MDCPECDRFWKQYQTATVQHLKLEYALRMTAEMISLENFKALSLDIEAAELVRTETRQAIACHMATHNRLPG